MLFNHFTQDLNPRRCLFHYSTSHCGTCLKSKRLPLFLSSWFPSGIIWYRLRDRLIVSFWHSCWLQCEILGSWFLEFHVSVCVFNFSSPALSLGKWRVIRKRLKEVNSFYTNIIQSVFMLPFYSLLLKNMIKRDKNGFSTLSWIKITWKNIFKSVYPCVQPPEILVQ